MVRILRPDPFVLLLDGWGDLTAAIWHHFSARLSHDFLGVLFNRRGRGWDMMESLAGVMYEEPVVERKWCGANAVSLQETFS